MAAPPSEPSWHPDPLGRYEYRLWSGSAWTDQVSDGGAQASDPIPPVVARSVTVRPSWRALRSRLDALPTWRRIVAVLSLVAVIPISFALLYSFVLLYGSVGWVAVGLFGGVGLLCLIALPILYFKVVYIRVDDAGIEIRNQVGYRKFLPREQIGLVSVGSTWGGGLSTSDFAFIVSRAGRQLARFYLQNWELRDIERVANGLGLQLYGRPGRQLDEFHSGKAVQRAAAFMGRSMAAGVIAGCTIPVLLIVGIAVFLLLDRLFRGSS